MDKSGAEVGAGIGQPVARAVDRLAGAGLPSPRTDAELLAAHVLGVARGRLVLVPGFSPAQLARFEELVRRRLARVPLQHLTGRAGFGELDLAVGPGVFIPRPETELLAHWAVGQPARVVVDLCSGSGALALAIAHARPAARVYAVECDPSALSWLRRNAIQQEQAGDTPIEIVMGDATDPAVLATVDGAVDLVVCNPPYVPQGRVAPPEVTGHDPPGAVFAGPDGLAVIRPVVARAASLLRPGGWLGLEHDETHVAAVAARLRPWFTQICRHRDLAGRPRFITAQRAFPPGVAD